jgi:hypothetical protein
MPFVKRDTAILSAAGPPADELAAHIAALPSRDAEARWQGARALAGRAEAVAPLAVALGVEAIPPVREAIMTALMRIGNAASVEALVPHLRSEDAGQRAAAIEALQGLPHGIKVWWQRGASIYRCMVRRACGVVRRWPPPSARMRRLKRALKRAYKSDDEESYNNINHIWRMRWKPEGSTWMRKRAAVILPPEGDAVAVARDQAAVGDGDAMGVRDR